MEYLPAFYPINWYNFLLAFIPIFVAIDVIGLLPIFISFIEGIEKPVKIKIINQSLLTAFSVSVGFIVVGKFVFAVLGIEIYDFKMAGGLLLLVFAIYDLLFSEKGKRTVTSAIGVVPLGIPLVVGPAVLTTLIITINAYGYVPTIFSLIVNLFIVWMVLMNSDFIYRLMGEGGSRAFAKIASLLLASIAVMMIRRGIVDMVMYIKNSP
ncbi:MAG: MarC family protein [Candidatus Loosdrechtia sp.]|uniref:MarC family protein n=1 Tax=Candidatus Loosdrechtia sp. TaxID=3101272 RepID=UPI003A623294|nr:MAG: MarC family protein [Candidatus Jettenia sp. AMX2]